MMAALMTLGTLFLVGVGGWVLLAVTPDLRGWGTRRGLQMLMLAAPVSSLLVGVASLRAVATHVCFLNVPPWDYTASVVGLAGIGTAAAGGLGLGILRLAAMTRVMAQRGAPAPPAVQAAADRLATRLHVARARVRAVQADHPVALTWGLRRPMILVSTWMLARLDERELETALAHELGHVARSDFAVLWLATVLRDAFFYLPASRAAYRQLQLEKELACDDLAVAVTGRPLALASALAKVWEALVSTPAMQPALLFAESGQWLERRIERLTEAERSVRVEARGAVDAPVALGASVLVGVVALGILAVGVMLGPMSCGPTSLWTLL